MMLERKTSKERERVWGTAENIKVKNEEVIEGRKKKILQTV